MRHRGLYQPRLHDTHIRKLYHLAKRHGVPMATLLNLIVATAIEELDHAPDLCNAPRVRRGSKEVAHG